MSNIIQINDRNGNPRFYDFGTKNESFLLTAKELKMLGIKNWYFMLEVKYPQLGVQDLDPWSPDLTSEEIGRIHIESKNNIWYWVREVAKVPAKNSPIPFDPYLTRASCAAVWCYDHNIDFRLCQPRQTYKTTWATLILVHGFLYDISNANIPFLHIRDGRAQDNARTFRDYITDGLPKYMNPWLNDKRLPGLKSIRYEAHKIGIKIIASAESPEKAMDLLRGETVAVTYWDEYEYIQHVDSISAGAAPAMHSAREIAESIGGKVCSIYTSTPGNLDTSAGKASQRMIDNTPRFSEKFYDLTDQELDEMFNGMLGDDSKPIKCLYIEFNWKQLRKTEKWLREQYNEAVATGKLDEYKRGVLLQRYRGSSKVLFRQEDVDYILNNQKTPDYEILIMKKYILYVYKHEVMNVDLTSDTPYFDINIPYLVGIDPATGSGGDNSAFVIVNPYTLETVGELKSPYMSTLDCMRVITQLALLLPKCIFCLESSGIGKTIVAYAEESPLVDRFYHDPKMDITKNAITLDVKTAMTLEERSRNRQYIGTAVTPGVRNAMMELLKRYVRDYRHLMLARFLVEDISKLIITKTGRIEAEAGEHDDIVFAWLHCIYVLTYGYDLARFGIDKSKCTYESSYHILDEYEKNVNENVVDNTLPYDGPTLYEDQLLHDLTSNKNESFGLSNGTDVYGYTRKQYAGVEDTPQDGISSSDLAFFREVNSFL
jgi:hypothetical protein